MENKIPDWVIEYNNANYQSSAGKAVKLPLAKVSEQEKEIERLREERKEMVSLLTRIHDNRTLSYKTLSDNHYREIKALLSKFEVPNQS